MSGKSQTSKNTAGEVTTHRFRAHIHTPVETSARGISLKWSWMNCIPGLRQKQTQISGRGFHLRMSASASTREMGLRFFFLLTAFPCLPAHAGSFRLPSLIKALTSLSLSKHQQFAFLGTLNMLRFFPQPCLWSTSFPAGLLLAFVFPVVIPVLLSQMKHHFLGGAFPEPSLDQV